MHIIPQGGRVKSASVDLDLLCGRSAFELDRHVAHLRKNPPLGLQTAFFPRTGRHMRHMLDGIGIYRPVLKTDQGMPGNFFPFCIDTTLASTSVVRRTVSHEEGAVLAEHWSGFRNGALHELRASFRELDLKATFGHVAHLEGRVADKGRFPLFFIRPGLVSEPFVFGSDLLSTVEKAVATQIHSLIETAAEAEETATGRARPHNLLYVQPDVYIERHGHVVVEALRCPDVGFFLTQLGEEADGSLVLPGLTNLMRNMRAEVCRHIVARTGPRITLLTRDEVLSRHEDMLELKEIESLTAGLTELGCVVDVASVDRIADLKNGTHVVLLNLDHQAAGMQQLYARHASGELICFPNPYVQAASMSSTALPSATIAAEGKQRERFLSLARSVPSHREGLEDVTRRLGDLLDQHHLYGEILHAKAGNDIIPILRHGMHSWRQFAARVQRPEYAGKPVTLMSVPIKPDRLMLPRLHVFRFMAVV